MYYPAECFSKDETRTARNFRTYEKRVDKVFAECLRRRPDYIKLSLRERYAVRQEVVKDIPFML